MPQFQLASKKMNTGPGPGGLSPVLIDGRIGSSRRAPQINVNAGNVQYSDMAPNEIIPDQTISQAGAAGAIMVQAAMDYQNRVEQATADQVVMMAQEARAAKWYGTEEAPGFMSTTGQGAVDARDAFFKDNVEITRQALENLPDAVKAKAAIRVRRGESDFTNRGSVHTAQQFKVWEKNIAQNQQDTALNEIASMSTNDPGGVLAKIKEHETNIAIQLESRPEAAELAIRAFRSAAFGGAVNYNITRAGTAESDADAAKYIQAADDYITRAHDFGVDVQDLAAMSAQITQVESSRAAARLQAQKRFQDQNDAELEADMQRHLNNSTVFYEKKDIKGAYAELDKIGSLEMRNSAYAIMQKADNFTSRDDALRFQKEVDAGNLNSTEVIELALKSNYKIGVSAVTAIANKVASDRASGVTAVRAKYSKMVDVMLLEYTKGFNSMFEAADAAATESKALEAIYDAVAQAEMNNTSPELAAASAWNAILTDPDFDEEYKLFAPSRASLSRVKGVESDMNILHQAGAGTSQEAVRRVYVSSVGNIYKKYDVYDLALDPKIKREDKWMAVLNAIPTRSARASFIRDMQKINRQNVYHRAQFGTEEQKGAREEARQIKGSSSTPKRTEAST